MAEEVAVAARATTVARRATSRVTVPIGEAEEAAYVQSSLLCCHYALEHRLWRFCCRVTAAVAAEEAEVAAAVVAVGPATTAERRATSRASAPTAE